MSVEVRYCPQCGTRRTGYFRFCGRCGFDFDELTIGKPPEAAELPAPPKPEPTMPMWPPPVQWPPADAAPPSPQEPEPHPVLWPPQHDPATPAPIVQPPIVQPPPDRPILAESLAPPLPRSPEAVETVPSGPVVSGRPVVTWTRILIIGLAALLAINAVSRAMTSSSGTGPTPVPTVVLGTPLIVPSPSGSASAAALTPGPNFGPTGPKQAAVVTRVVDGDTIRVEFDGTEHPVRYIGIDSPEPSATDPAVKRLADAATATNVALVEGHDVVLERDVSETDPFDRLLRNVWLVDGGGSLVLVNLELVRLGFATVTTFDPDVKYEAYLLTAQDAARSEARGLWGAPSTLDSTPSPVAVVTPNTLIGGGADCHPSYSPCLPVVGDLDCADVRAMGKAPVSVKGPDEYRLDGDNDGLGCE